MLAHPRRTRVHPMLVRPEARLRGYVYCWDSGWAGQLGDGRGHLSAIPVKVTADGTMDRWDVADAGYLTTCAVPEGSRYGVFYWSRLADTMQPMPVLMNQTREWADVSVAYEDVCGLTGAVTRGHAYWCGGNSWGQLGAPPTATYSAPAEVEGGHVWTFINAGWGHTCGVAIRKEADCWGEGEHGQLGDGSATGSNAPG